MHIVIPILGFGRKGGYRVLSELANQWVARGHRVQFFSPADGALPYFPTDAETIWLDSIGNRMLRGNGKTIVDRRGPQGVARLLYLLWQGLNRYADNCDIILANQSLTVWPVSLTNSQAQKYYYIQAYEPEYYAEYNGLKYRILEMLSKFGYYLPLNQIVNSPVYFGYKQIRARQYSPPGIDFSVMYPKANLGAINGDEIVIGCIGRHEPQKGTRYVLEAFNKLIGQGLPVKLHVAYGNIPEEVSTLDNCTVVIPQNDSELGDFYRDLDILVAPGTVQLGAPHYPVLEGMACGVPVITTGYIPADDTNAWLVPVHDGDSIQEAVVDIWENSFLRSQRVQKALKDVQIFSWTTVAESMLNMFLNGTKLNG